MATEAANINRAADLQRRLMNGADELAVAAGIDLPPTFPYVRDAAYRANDQTEWCCMVIEAVTKAIQEKGQNDG